MQMWIWRVTNPNCGAYLEGSEFDPDEARREALKSQTRLALQFEVPPQQIEARVTGPRGGVERFRKWRGAGPTRWIKDY